METPPETLAPPSRHSPITSAASRPFLPILGNRRLRLATWWFFLVLSGIMVGHNLVIRSWGIGTFPSIARFEYIHTGTYTQKVQDTLLCSKEARYQAIRSPQAEVHQKIRNSGAVILKLVWNTRSLKIRNPVRISASHYEYFSLPKEATPHHYLHRLDYVARSPLSLRVHCTPSHSKTTYSRVPDTLLPGTWYLVPYDTPG